MKTALNGFNEKLATFEKNGAIKAGDPVKLSGNNTAAACANGDLPVGVAVSVYDDCVTVQLCGYTKVKYSSTAPSLGYAFIKGNGASGVTSASDTAGRAVIVTEVDSVNSTVGIIL